VLRGDGVFVTQQAGSGARRFHEVLELEPPADTDFHLELALDQLQRNGLRVEQFDVAAVITRFSDIGALAWYLSNVPWGVPGFTIERHRDVLLRLHGHAIRIPSERFWIRAIA
jgi:hypothetical protein